MKKLKVYIHSFEIPTVGSVDKEGALHACAQAQRTAFEGLKRLSGLGDRFLPDDQIEVLRRVEDFCSSNGVDFEVVDFGTIGFLKSLKLKMKGLKNPAISCGEKTIYGVPSERDLKELLKG